MAILLDSYTCLLAIQVIYQQSVSIESSQSSVCILCTAVDRCSTVRQEHGVVVAWQSIGIKDR